MDRLVWSSTAGHSFRTDFYLAVQVEAESMSEADLAKIFRHMLLGVSHTHAADSESSVAFEQFPIPRNSNFKTVRQAPEQIPCRVVKVEAGPAAGIMKTDLHLPQKGDGRPTQVQSEESQTALMTASGSFNPV